MSGGGQNDTPRNADGRAEATREAAQLEDARLKARLDRLSERLETFQSAHDAAASTRKSAAALVTSSALGLGMRVLGEFVGAVGFGALIGWLGDRLLGTAPILLLVFLAIGAVAGFWSIYRLAAQAGGGSAKPD